MLKKSIAPPAEGRLNVSPPDAPPVELRIWPYPSEVVSLEGLDTKSVFVASILTHPLPPTRSKEIRFDPLFGCGLCSSLLFPS